MIKMDIQIGLNGDTRLGIKRYRILRIHMWFLIQLVRMVIRFVTRMLMKGVAGFMGLSQGFGIGN